MFNFLHNYKLKREKGFFFFFLLVILAKINKFDNI